MKLSIIIPVYNVEKYISKCLDSVIGIPVDSDYEIIVVNDGTKDNSMIVVAEYERTPNLRVINQSNQGLGAARNTGLRYATGDWVYFLDSDDYINPTAFAELFNKAKDNESIDIITGDYCYVYRDSVEKGRYVINIKEDLILSGNDFLINHYHSVNTMVWRSIYRKTMLIDNSLFFTEGAYHEDVNWTPKCIAAAKKVYYSPVPFYYYLIREGSIVQSARNTKKINDLLYAYDDLLKHFSTHKKEIQEYISRSTLISLFVLNGQYGIYKDRNLYKRYKEVLNNQCAQSFKTRLLFGVYRLFPMMFNKVLSLRYAAKDTKNIF